jgi:hypothetical protein
MRKTQRDNKKISRTRDRKTKRTRGGTETGKVTGKYASEYKLVFGNICYKFAILNFLFCEKVSLQEDIENK